MSMNNENYNTANNVPNNTTSGAVNSTPNNSGLPPMGTFRTAGQAMQPPILSPSTTMRPPVYMQVNSISPASPAQVSASSQQPAPVTQQTAPVTQASAPQWATSPILTPATLAPQAPAASQQNHPSEVQTKSDKKAAKAEKATARKADKASRKALKSERKQKKASSGVSMSKKSFAAVAVAFCVLGAGLGTCAVVAFGMHWAEQVKTQAVSEAKKTAQKAAGNGSSSSDSKAKNQSTVVEGNRDYAVLNTSTIDTSELHTASEIYAANVNSTVGILTSINNNYYTGAAAGSGFILTADGYIVTNYHVIEDANAIEVTNYDDTTYDATVIGYDEESDLAVLKIDAENLTPVILGDSDNLNVGDDVLAIGNPLGDLAFSLTKGCVSALNRTVTIDNLSMNLIQTDCAINSGNSGGALFNMYGEVIGITNAKYSNNDSSDAAIENIGFAIPINSVRDIIDSIIEKGYADKPYIGVYAETVSPYTNSNYDADEGIGIADIVDDSPAEKAGIQNGDVIIKINGKKVTDVSELKAYINAAGIGGELNLTILRNGSEIEITVIVGADTAS